MFQPKNRRITHDKINTPRHVRSNRSIFHLAIVPHHNRRTVKKRGSVEAEPQFTPFA